MRSFFKILKDVTKDILHNIAYFVKNNLMNFVGILEMILPYVMYFIGQNLGYKNGKIIIGFEIVIPLAFVIVTYYIRAIANKIGKGITVPVPSKRFTQIDDDGEVTVENARLQELLLYTADLEDWLEKKNLL